MNSGKGRHPNVFLVLCVLLYSLGIGQAAAVTPGDPQLAGGPIGNPSWSGPLQAQNQLQRQPMKPPGPVTPPGSRPQNVVVQPNGPAGYLIKWDQVPGAIGYTVVRNPSSSLPVTVASGIPYSPDGYFDDEVGPGTTTMTYYMVLSEFPSRTLLSPGKSDIVFYNVGTPLTKNPTGFHYTQDSNGYVTLSWTPVPSAELYWLQGDGLPAPQKLVGQNNTSITIPPPAPPLSRPPPPLKPGMYNYTLLAYFGKRGQFGKEEAPARLTVIVGGTVQKISGPPSVKRGDTAFFDITGLGHCGELRVYFGDTIMTPYQNVVFKYTQPDGTVVPQYPFSSHHAYTGWGGKKTVRAEGVPPSCIGKAVTSINVERMVYTIALFANPPPTYASSPKTCRIDPNMPIVRTDTWVHITTNPDPTIRINFGGGVGVHPFRVGDVVLDADGEKPTKAPSDYPFPDFYKNSLVIRIGSQIIQGGTNVTFRANQPGSMEFCINDKNLSDNTGAWGIHIEVDEPAM